MGDLLLVLTLVGIICGGIPILAVAYINGTLKIPGLEASRTRKLSNPAVIKISVLILGATLGCFCFPVYNLTKEYTGTTPLNQICGYILTEDPTYITNHNNARTIIARIDRETLLRDIVTKYFE